jgi:D-methionine transport system substrate-binding protein
MPLRRRVLLPLLVLAAASAASPSRALAADVVRLGVTAGAHAQIAEVAKKVAAREGLEIRIVEFQDYIQPDAALDAGELDANSYQHRPFLESQIQARGYRISAVGDTVTFPMGFYSRRVKSLAALAPGARVGIQNDPSNSGRALQLLQKAGAIRLKPGAGIGATTADIVENPKGLRIVQLEAAQLARSLEDLDGGDQHQLRAAGGAAARARRDRDRGREVALREPARGAHRGQGQALGGQAGEGLPVAGGARVHRRPVRGLDGAGVLMRRMRSARAP